MAGIENDDPSADVAAAIAQLDGGEPVPQGHGDLYSEPAPPEPPQERQRAPTYQEQWKAANVKPVEQPASERRRDAHGRFTSKTDEPTSLTESKLTVDQAAARINKAIDAPAEKQDQPLDPNAPPKRWPKESRALWDRLPNEIRGPLARQLHADEENLSKAFDIVNGRQQALQNYQQMDQLFAPHRQTYARYGFQNDVQALNHLLTLQTAFERDPASALQWLAQQFRVPARFGLGQYQPQQQQAPVQPQYQDPRYQGDMRAAIREEIGLAAAASEIQAFQNDPRYPHFKTVRPVMSQLLQGGHAATLEDAYLAAVNADPQLRAEHQRQQAQAEARRQSSSVAAKRRAASVSLSGAPNGAVAPSRYGNGQAKNHHDDAANDVRAAISQLQ